MNFPFVAEEFSSDFETDTDTDLMDIDDSPLCDICECIPCVQREVKAYEFAQAEYGLWQTRSRMR